MVRWSVILLLGACDGDLCRQRAVPITAPDLSLEGEVIADVLARAESPVQVEGVGADFLPVDVEVRVSVDREGIEAVEQREIERPWQRQLAIWPRCPNFVRAPAVAHISVDGERVAELAGAALIGRLRGDALRLDVAAFDGGASWLGETPGPLDPTEVALREGALGSVVVGDESSGGVWWARDLGRGRVETDLLLVWPPEVLNR